MQTILNRGDFYPTKVTMGLQCATSLHVLILPDIEINSSWWGFYVYVCMYLIGFK